MSTQIFHTEDPVLRAQIPHGIPLIIAMRGLSDAGGVLSQLDSYFSEHCDPQVAIRFITDELLDYRSRRPTITFSEDHFEGYEPEELVLALAHDTMGAPFLVLSGFEPDFRWDGFIDSLLLLIHEFEVSRVVWAHAIPMPVPHTRPIKLTVSGSRDDLIETYSVWKPTSKLPATAAHVLEYRLHQLGEEVVGFALLVPHYLANTEYPSALITGLECIMAATGMLFATDTVRTSADAFDAQVNLQISENDESVEMVRGLEVRYDAYVAQQNSEESQVEAEVDIAVQQETAEQLVNDLERFLAEGMNADSPDSEDTEERPEDEPPFRMQ